MYPLYSYIYSAIRPLFVTDSSLCSSKPAPVLEQELEQLKRIVDAKFPGYDSEDPLDLGEACWLAHWFPAEEWSQVTYAKLALWNTTRRQEKSAYIRSCIVCYIVCYIVCTFWQEMPNAVLGFLHDVPLGLMKNVVCNPWTVPEGKGSHEDA